MLIIGSTALKLWYPDFKREPKDVDFVVRNSSHYKNNKGFEFLENPVFLDWVMIDEGYIKPHDLLTLKISHMFWDFNWDKHMWDIQFLFSKGHMYHKAMLYELIKYWEETKPKIRRSNLNMSREDFFDNAVNDDEFKHDYLHTLVAEVPAYTKLLKEGAEVELDEDKWNRLSIQEKKDVVFEETAVMAYERYKNSYYKIGYNKQLKDNIIKHFPKYIAIFAIENYIELLEPKFNFQKKIQNGLQSTK